MYEEDPERRTPQSISPGPLGDPEQRLTAYEDILLLDLHLADWVLAFPFLSFVVGDFISGIKFVFQFQAFY